ncbi:hypothetical protein DERF_000182 [Dermatophagoides farinae]|uniref:Uncharacterized protein n=1 Tax=Dermatophagoides farinae TaxID=6954 RepID=A0A922I9M3_DERFA|nr:hypothetical protein DERF_000182 [Dermatophagoides farinae]
MLICRIFFYLVMSRLFKFYNGWDRISFGPSLPTIRCSSSPSTSSSPPPPPPQPQPPTDVHLTTIRHTSN